MPGRFGDLKLWAPRLRDPSFPVQFAYWWYGAGFNQMYFISTNVLPIIMGEATKLIGPLF